MFIGMRANALYPIIQWLLYLKKVYPVRNQIWGKDTLEET